MATEKNRIMKRSTAFIMAVIMILELVSLHITASSEEPTPEQISAVREQRLPTSTPRPEIMLLADIPAEDVALSTKLYNDLLGYDPELFLMSDEGIKHLWFYWDDVGTDEELAYLKSLAAEITEDCSGVEDKIFAVAKYLAQNVGYDYDYLESLDVSQLAVNPWDVLMKQATVCEGYARTTAALLQCLDIPCVCAYSPNHVWNIAYTGERWMLFDTTWMTNGRYENGILTLSDVVSLDWYDFTIEQANGNGNHTIEETDLCVIDGVLTKFPCYTEKTSVALPTTVEEIGDYAYITRENCDIEVVYIPSSLKNIGEVAFYYGDPLKTIYYQGTEDAFSNITIERWNSNFTSCSDIRYLDEVSAPYITKHPADVNMGKGNSVTLSAEAAVDTGTLTYQWYKAASRTNKTGTPIDGAVTTSLTVAGDNVGEYYYYMEATVTAAAFSGVKTKTVKTVPCQVRVFETVPSSVIRVGPAALMYIYTGSQTVEIEGSGEVSANWWDIPYSSTVYIDKDITSIADPINTFKYTAGVVVEEGSAHYKSDSAGALYDLDTATFLVLPYYASATELVVPEGIRHIAAGAIGKTLTSIVLPGTLETIGGPLVPTNRLTHLSLSSESTNFYIDEYGALIDKAGKRIVCFPSSSADFYNPLEQYIMPDGILYIEDFAFEFANIRSVVFNDDLISIGKCAFYNNSRSTTFEFPATLKSIGESAFAYNQYLTKVYFRGDAPEKWGTQMFQLWDNYDPVEIYYADTASGWSTPTWTHPDDPSTTYTTHPYDTGDITVISVSVAYTVYKQVVTLPDNGAACRVGYLKNGVYTALTGVRNTDGSYSFTVPDGITEVLAVVAGDVDGDGDVDTADAKALAGSLMPSGMALSAAEQFAADINLNGKLNSADRVLLSRSLLDESHAMYKALQW
ncbi:MAG: hypothetical protein E7658_02350 [Ruminococcaceae bacterium]|nr:hypothetical protein [Oscillospiraceae bacterium]